jgi:hypothetical protein
VRSISLSGGSIPENIAIPENIVIPETSSSLKTSPSGKHRYLENIAIRKTLSS